MSNRFQFQADRVSASAFIANNATVLGDVAIGERSSVWFGSVIRGDTESIVIGEESNIQDLCVLHADPGFPCVIGDRVTVGHAAIVHGARVDDDVMIGMRAVILNGASIGSGSVIAAGCVVTERMVIPPGSLVMGVPGRIKHETDQAARDRIAQAARHYAEMAEKFRAASPSHHLSESPADRRPE